MELGINTTAFKGTLDVRDVKGVDHALKTDEIESIVPVSGRIMIQTKHTGYNGDGSYTKDETVLLNGTNVEDFDRLMRCYDIASRNNVTIRCPQASEYKKH